MSQRKIIKTKPCQFTGENVNIHLTNDGRAMLQFPSSVRQEYFGQLYFKNLDQADYLIIKPEAKIVFIYKPQILLAAIERNIKPEEYPEVTLGNPSFLDALRTILTPDPTPEPNTKPFYKSLWFWSGIILLGLAGFGIGSYYGLGKLIALTTGSGALLGGLGGGAVNHRTTGTKNAPGISTTSAGSNPYSQIPFTPGSHLGHEPDQGQPAQQTGSTPSIQPSLVRPSTGGSMQQPPPGRRNSH